jgi:hypothetical protein
MRCWCTACGGSGRGWQSFDYRGVHFVGLVSVLNFKVGKLGSLGHEQLEGLERDVAPLAASTPVVVFAHVPLWAVYPQWGWVTDDGAQALAYFKRFGSVTVLNGHIHQIMQKVEGNVTFTRRWLPHSHNLSQVLLLRPARSRFRQMNCGTSLVSLTSTS